MRAPFDPNSHHARLLMVCASYRRQIATGRTIFDRDFLLTSARIALSGARDTRLAVEGWINLLALMIAWAMCKGMGR